MKLRQLTLAVAAATAFSAASAQSGSMGGSATPGSSDGSVSSTSGDGMPSSQRGATMQGSQSTGDPAVREIQQALQDKGHDVGPIDGIMGEKTHGALREFQQSQGLQASGQLTSETRDALGVQGSAGTGSSGSSRPGSSEGGKTGGSSSSGTQSR